MQSGKAYEYKKRHLALRHFLKFVIWLANNY